MIISEAVAILKFISVGLDVADKALDLSKDFVTSIKSQEDKAIELEGLMKKSTLSIQQAINDSENSIIDKLEQDKLEELISRIKNVMLLLKIGKQEQLLSYVLTLQESVDYAENRLKESKKQWFLPYIVGKAMVTATFSYIGETEEEAIHHLQNMVRQTKIQILDEISCKLYEFGKPIPWDLIGDVLDNKENSIHQFIELIPTTTFDLTGEWKLKQTDTSGGLVANVYLIQHGNRLYGHFLITTKSGQVQEFIEGTVEGDNMDLCGIWYKASQGYNLDRWKGKIRDANYIAGESSDVQKAVGNFKLQRV